MTPEFSRIASYTILRKLGQGGAGEVWLGYDPSLRRDVAIKLLKAEFQSKDELVARFLQEARITAQLNHPNIVTVFQVGQHMGRYFIAMEYLPRGSVQDELARRGRLDWREATLIVRDAVCGLGAAHEANIIHRDVKPGNLLRAENGTAKVGDFGLARLESSSSILTLPGKIFGTPSFIAPEQIRGSMVDTRADFYSLACTYYALLSGHAPFSTPGENVAPDVLLYRHVHEPFPDVQQEVPDLPAGVAAILARGSQKDPADRYQNAWEFYRDLESVLSSPAVVPPRPVAQARERVEAKKEEQPPRTWIMAGIFALGRHWKKILAALAAILLLSEQMSGRGDLKQATFSESSVQWQRQGEKQVAAALERREVKLRGLSTYSWEEIRSHLFPKTFGIPATGYQRDLVLPTQFILRGTLAAVRSLEGKTWVCVAPDPIRPWGRFEQTVLVAFDNSSLAKATVDYRMGDPIRLVVSREDWGEFRERPEALHLMETRPDLSCLLRHLACFRKAKDDSDYLCFRGEAMEKTGQPETWIEAGGGSIRKASNQAQLLASPGMILRNLSKWVGKEGAIQGDFLDATILRGRLAVRLVVTNSLEGPFGVRLDLGQHARAQEFLDYAQGDTVLAEILIKDVETSETSNPRRMFLYEPSGPMTLPPGLEEYCRRGPVRTRRFTNPLADRNVVRAACSRLQKVGQPATLVRANGPRRTVPTAQNQSPTTTPGREGSR